MQRGFALTIILAFLAAVSLGVLGYYLNKQQTIKNINSFEDCAKYFPVMESYPAQCNTSDGRHFVQELSEEEKKKLQPPVESSESADIDEIKKVLVKKLGADDGRLIVTFDNNSKFREKFASGGINQIGGGGGAKWFAARVGEEWKIVSVGNGIPECEDVNQYDIPAEILNICVDKLGELVDR